MLFSSFIRSNMIYAISADTEVHIQLRKPTMLAIQNILFKFLFLNGRNLVGKRKPHMHRGIPFSLHSSCVILQIQNTFI